MVPKINFLSLVVSSLFLSNFASAADRHSTRLKSIRSTDDECQRYLNVRDGNCNVRCRGLVDRFWDDQSSLGLSIMQFYQPDPEDRCYMNRTVRCLKRVSATENCERVDRYVQCFNNQYGHQDTRTARYIPFTPVQHTRILMECAAVLGISVDSLKQAAENGSEMPQEACLLRCFLIRQGLYSDAGGLDLERLEVQCGGYGSDWDPAAVQQCIAKVEDCDKCSRVQRIARDCLQLRFKVLPNPNCDTVESLPFQVEFYVGISILGIKFKGMISGCLLGLICLFA